MLRHKLKNSFKFEGVRVVLTLAFNNVLAFYELQDDALFDDQEKVLLGFDLLCKSRKKLNTGQKTKILQHVLKEYVNVVHIKGKESTKKCLDFNQDAGHIWSSFISDYNIDLNKEIGSLDWRKFIWLFHGLSEKSKIKQIMSIRSRDIPKRTKHNNEEINHLLELKAMYALEMSEDERKKAFAESLKAIAKRYIPQ